MKKLKDGCHWNKKSGPDQPGAQGLQRSRASECHLKGLHLVHTPWNDVPNCSSFSFCLFFFSFGKSQRKREKIAQREEPAAEPVRRKKNVDMMLILLHFLTFYERLAGRCTPCPKDLGSFDQEQQSVWGWPCSLKISISKGRRKETKADMISIRSLRWLLKSWLGENNKLCFSRLETFSFQNTGIVRRSWNVYCDDCWGRKQASSCTSSNIHSKGGLCAS